MLRLNRARVKLIFKSIIYNLHYYYTQNLILLCVSVEFEDYVKDRYLIQIILKIVLYNKT